MARARRGRGEGAVFYSESKGCWVGRGGPQARRSARVRVKAPDLLTFMWFQLGLWVTGASQFRQCEGCTRWFLPSRRPAGRAACSACCGVKAARARHRLAVELREQGWPVVKIARKIGADVAKVKQWVSTKKGK